jgi:hypothetical protein
VLPPVVPPPPELLEPPQPGENNRRNSNAATVQPTLLSPDVLFICSNSSPGKARAKAKLSRNGLGRSRALLAAVLAVLMVSVTEAGNDVTWDGENEHAAPVGKPVQAKVVAPEGVPWVAVTFSDSLMLPPAFTEALGGLIVNPS